MGKVVRILWILGLALVQIGCACSPEQVPESKQPKPARGSLALADRAWANRGADCAGAFRQCKAYQQQRPSDYAALWRLARAYYYWSDYCLGPARTKEDQKAPHLRQGLAYAEKALEAEPDRVEGIFWSGLLLARLSQVEGVLRSMHRLGRIRRLLRKSLRFSHPSNAAAHAALAVVEITLRRKRLLLVSGDLDRAIAHLQQSIKLRPRSALTWIYLAEAYRLEGRTADGVATLRHALGIKPEEPLGKWYPDAQNHETRVDKQLAAQLIETWQAEDREKR